MFIELKQFGDMRLLTRKRKRRTVTIEIKLYNLESNDSLLSKFIEIRELFQELLIK